MDFRKSKRLLLRLTFYYFLLASLVFTVSGKSFRYTDAAGVIPAPSGIIGEITDGVTIEQKTVADMDYIQSIDVFAANYMRENSGVFHVSVYSENGELLASQQVENGKFKDNDVMRIEFSNAVTCTKGENLTLQFRSDGCEPGNAITLYYSEQTVQPEAPEETAPQATYTVGGSEEKGSLCLCINGYNELTAYKIFWPLIFGLYFAAAILAVCWWRQAKRGKNNPLVVFCSMAIKYRFLLSQLVSRDFKKKYKRSVLGVGWSILNPLLTMGVQYIVFSTIFSNGTKNYPVYLLTGIVFFNFFNEAISLGMTSITSNAALIKKVYVPKYIYPFSKVLSSLINFGTSLLPLFAVMAFTGNFLKPSLLLLIYDLLCLIVFVTGMTLILSTCMTFFQDTLFLWGVVSMIWMYLTPIFYMERIIPERFIHFYRINPMYQFVTFARTCIIDGISPAPISYVWCALSAVAALTLGMLIFHKNQNRFVLYL